MKKLDLNGEDPPGEGQAQFFLIAKTHAPHCTRLVHSIVTSPLIFESPLARDKTFYLIRRKRA